MFLSSFKDPDSEAKTITPSRRYIVSIIKFPLAKTCNGFSDLELNLKSSCFSNQIKICSEQRLNEERELSTLFIDDARRRVLCLSLEIRRANHCITQRNKETLDMTVITQ